MNKGMTRTVGDHFIAEMPKNFAIDAIDLEAGLVFDDSTRVQTGGPFRPDGRVKQESWFR